MSMDLQVGHTGSIGPHVARNSKQGELDICHRGCAYTILQTVQRPGMCSVVYGTVQCALYRTLEVSR